MAEDEGVRTTSWDGYLKEGPGAVTTAVPIIEVDGHGGHVLEPEYKRMPIGPEHILYPVMVGLALFPILMGASGHHLADDLPDTRVDLTIAGDGAFRALTSAPSTSAYIAAHAALRLDGPPGYGAERAWQSRWLVERLKLRADAA